MCFYVQARSCEALCKRAALLLMTKYDQCQNQVGLGVISYRFLHPAGPFRRNFQLWAEGKTNHMDQAIFTELMSYACALTSMQRLEGRHSRLKKILNWRSFQLPASLSAAMRRKQNGDLTNPRFRDGLADFLSRIGELHQGDWGCKTALIESFLRRSQDACHDPLDNMREKRENFQAALASAQASTAGTEIGAEEIDESHLWREHIKTAFQKGGVYALKNALQVGAWSVFGVLHTAPGGNMYMQRSCYMSTDVTWFF